MTRIKKRRSGKKKTSDQQRSAAGRRRARSAEKAIPALKEQDAANEVPAKKTPPYKKRFEPSNAGRRGGRAAEKAASTLKEQHTTGGITVKPTGKTRSAGARRVAAAKSVAIPGKGKKLVKKTAAPKKETAADDKPVKGFAPWNKNKFKRKDKKATAKHLPEKKIFADNKKRSR